MPTPDTTTGATEPPQAHAEAGFESHRHEVYGWAYRLLGRHHDALDVAQDVFMRWLDQVADEVPTQPRAWLRRVTINRSIDVLRRRGRPGAEPKLLEQVVARVEDDPEQQELRRCIGAALESLSDAQRGVMIAKVFDGLTFAEVATEQQIAIPTAKTHFLRAARSLRGALAPYWSPDGDEGSG